MLGKVRTLTRATCKGVLQLETTFIEEHLPSLELENRSYLG